VLVTHLKSTAQSEIAGAFFVKGHSHPTIVEVRFDCGITLHLKLEEGSGAEETIDFADITLDHLEARNVLEDQAGKGEVEFEPGTEAEAVPPAAADGAKVAAVVVVDVRVGESGDSLAGVADHVAADIDGMDFTEEVRQRRGDAAGAASDLEDLHALGIFALADIAEVVENVVAELSLAGLVEFLIGPLLLAGGYVVAGIFQRPPVPVPPHLAEMAGNPRFSHLVLL